MGDLATPLGPPCALVANLPYAVAATVVLRFFEELPSLRFAVVMVQAEVADRMSAVPGTKDWGAYSVKLQLRARSVGRFRVAPSCFMPPPRVDSAVLRLERVDDPVPAELMASASRMAEAAFAQRRKTLRNSVRSSLGVDSGQLDALLEETGIDGTRRAETLALDEYLELGAGAVRHGILP